MRARLSRDRTMNATIHGDIELGRSYDKSSSEIEWKGCPNVICGHARRIGIDSLTGLAIYKLSSRRHPHLTGCLVIVGSDGGILRVGDLLPISAAHFPHCQCRDCRNTTAR